MTATHRQRLERRVALLLGYPNARAYRRAAVNARLIRDARRLGLLTDGGPNGHKRNGPRSRATRSPVAPTLKEVSPEGLTGKIRRRPRGRKRTR